MVLWTADEEHARAAQADDLTVYTGDPTRDATESTPSELDGLAYVLAVGENEALNATVATDLAEYFGRGHVFQLPAGGPAAPFLARVPILFDESATHQALLTRIDAGDRISVAGPPGANGGTDPRAALGTDGIAMFIHTPGKDLHVLTAGERTELHEGQELIGLHGDPKRLDSDQPRRTPGGLL